MTINWDDLENWGDHVTESDCGSWLPEKTRSK
jgi:hypothetical protein